MKETEVHIRLATLDDAQMLQQIYAPYVEKTAISLEYVAPDVKEFRGRMVDIMKKYPYLVAEQNGEILGYAYAKAFHERAAFAWSVETTIYIRNDKKKIGLGRILYEKLEEELKKQNVQSVNACIACPIVEDAYLTRNSMEFHQHMGYELVAHFKKIAYKFDSWYDLVWMEKQIGDGTKRTESPLPFQPWQP